MTLKLDLRSHASQNIYVKQDGARRMHTIDPLSVANELGASYSIAVEEIFAIVIKEADAAGISHL
jgi:hypothetical protein